MNQPASFKKASLAFHIFASIAVMVAFGIECHEQANDPFQIDALVASTK